MLSTPILVFYLLGYRYDFKQQKIIQPGAIVLNIQPDLTPNILLNQKVFRAKKLSNLFQNSYAIRNLIAGPYSVSIINNDFEPYNKDIIIESLRIASLTDVVLLPKLSRIETAISEEYNILDFVLSPNKNLIAYLAANKDKETCVLYL